MPIRNPFSKKVLGEIEVRDENLPFQRRGPDGGFQKTNVTGARPIEIKEPTEYKLSGKMPPCARYTDANC